MTALAAWLWQGLLLAVVIHLLLRAMPRPNAATRHLAWWAALAGVVFLGAVHAGGDVAAVSESTARITAPAALPTAPVLTLPEAGWLLALVLGAWIGIAVYGLGRVVRGMRHVAGLRRHAVPLDAELAARLPMWSQTRRLNRQAQLCVTSELVGACALGFRRPAILVSRQLVETLDDGVLDQVVMHEQAHLDRYDDWLRLLQSIVTAVVGIHPAVHVIGRQIDLEREAACDDRVVSVTGAADRYAACLMEAAVAAASRVPVSVPSVLGARSSARSLRARIMRLLDPRPDHGRRFVLPVVAGVVVWLTVVLAAAPQLPALVAFVRLAVPLPEPRAALGLVSSAPLAAPALELDGDGPVVQRRAAPPPVGRPLSPPPVASQPPAQVGPSSSPPSQASPAAESLPIERLTAAHFDIPADALGGLSTTVTDLPPSQRVSEPAPVAPKRPAADSTLLTDMAWVGRNSAATARKAGVSVAGTFARAGKALGKFF